MKLIRLKVVRTFDVSVQRLIIATLLNDLIESFLNSYIYFHDK